MILKILFLFLIFSITQSADPYVAYIKVKFPDSTKEGRMNISKISDRKTVSIDSINATVCSCIVDHTKGTMVTKGNRVGSGYEGSINDLLLEILRKVRTSHLLEPSPIAKFVEVEGFNAEDMPTVHQFDLGTFYVDGQGGAIKCPTKEDTPKTTNTTSNKESVTFSILTVAGIVIFLLVIALSIWYLSS